MLVLAEASSTIVKSPQVLNSISSIAKSLPQPPAPLLIILRITEVSLPVLNTRPYSFQIGVAVSTIFPVFPETIVPLISISKRTLMGMAPDPQKPPASTKLITHAENS